MIVLLSVLAFWIIAAWGGLGLLRSGRAPLETLMWLYAVLALIGISSIALCLAVADISRLIRRELQEYRQPPVPNPVPPAPSGASRPVRPVILRDGSTPPPNGVPLKTGKP